MKLHNAYQFARAQRKKPTPVEKLFWEKVRGKKINGFKINRQFPIQHATEPGYKFHFFPDFYCSQKKLVIEIDGEIHDQQIEYDQKREERLKELGYHIIRFKNKDVLENWDEVKEKLINKLESLEDRY